MKRIKVITVLMMAVLLCFSAVASANEVSFYDSVNEWIVTAYSEENPTQEGAYSVYLNILNKDGVRVEADLILLTREGNRLDPQTNGDYLICGCAVSDQISLAYNTSGGQSEIFVLDRHNENETEVVKVHNHIHLSGFYVPDPPNLLVTGDGNFGTVNVGSTSIRNFTVYNTGEANLVLDPIGPLGTGFTLSSDNCSGQTLAAAGTCGITITFAPTAATTYNGTLAIPSNDPTPPSDISLYGTGFQQTGTADLVVSKVFHGGNITSGGTLYMTIYVKNQGNGPAGPFIVRGTRSSATGTEMYSWNVPSLGAGQVMSQSFTYIVSCSTHATIYLFHIADPTSASMPLGQVEESNEKNNKVITAVSCSR